MDFDLTGLVAILPNLAVAIYVIWRDGKREEKLLDTQKWLVEQIVNIRSQPAQPEQTEAL